ncbi:Subtilisin-like protease [Melia azedarach]|uniref:Subtilisin-like protease n=1 Tax=Melia azedarach TaxID=155640 RepID=A0ACC1YQV3_MELAZ|nr:Subtilisin-like protease [Melia azedarach]
MTVPNFSFLLLFFTLISLSITPIFAAKKSYIVYLGRHPHKVGPSAVDLSYARNAHYELLGSCLGSVQQAKDSIFYSYNRFINGFAAVMDEEHAQMLGKNPNVVSVFLNKGRKLHTTRSWDFLGLEKNNVIPSNSAWKTARFGEDTIIGTLDTGVWPESKSFSDEGMGPLPSKWRGFCQNDTTYGVKCNRKLIGMRFFNQGYISYVQTFNSSFTASPEISTARDLEGHGSHTLSTAGGNFVANVSVLGNGYGTAKGGSPKSRVAAYKVCWEPIFGQGCFDADILAGFEAAIADGVDVISVSLGGGASEFFDDALAIGSFHAMMRGIVVVASAGNSGPTPASATNLSPWLLTVGASTIDRDFASYITLGNKKILKGASLSAKGTLSKNSYPLISGADARVANATTEDANTCKTGTIDPTKIKGKILICLTGDSGTFEMGSIAAEGGAVGLILANNEFDGNELNARADLLPTANINFADGQSIFTYINSNKNAAVASMSGTVTELNTKRSPEMASFSSRGPNQIEPFVIKPDVTAPGVNVIAAYSEGVSPSGAYTDKRRFPYNSLSGTSMACPHVSGIVGLLKTLHPDWSPAAIRSAIMTTAISDVNKQPILDSTKVPATPFAYGAGQVNPNNALDPGLVYELNVDDYLSYLCSRHYNHTMIDKFSYPEKYICPPSFNIADFNYPSIAIPSLNGTFTVTRRAKNVAKPGTYKALVKAPAGVSVIVEPNTLSFTKVGEELPFKVIFNPVSNVKNKDYAFGDITWSDGIHNVRSPIAVKL